MKKVLLISHYPPPSGGIASWTKRLLEIGLSDGWQIVHINSNMIRGRDSYEHTKMRLWDEIVRSIGIWKREWKALRSDRDREILVVHTCIPCKILGMIREIVTGVIAKINGRKFILHCRCTVPNVVNTTLKRKVFCLLAALCDGIMVLNEKSYAFVRENVADRTQVECIPNFVSASEFCSADERVWSETVDNLVYDGGVIAEKGCDIIIEAARALPKMTFHLIGNVGSDIKALSTPDNVVFYGNREKPFIREMLLKCDAFLFLTRFWGEGFSNSLVEAMSAGLPCIVTDWAANADMVGQDGGVVLHECNVQKLIEAIEHLGTAKTREKMGRRNMRVAGERYKEDVIVPQYTAFYEKVLSSR